MIYPLVREMAATGAPVRVPVAVACRVLGFSEQAYYQWLKNPVSAREAEEQHCCAPGSSEARCDPFAVRDGRVV